ncbi:lipopolysaccharide biosynthesis protein [Brachybacterium sp. UMB0905]|uniref:lipopolysaccharide biosynthesis protein n=1 Tax=Brachybacterium sp. UMB0905 TaxID=2069310 RepID=UPI0013041E59|nr:oligosaccharide flippase family protein [Brachybacterium sp. UMB0905]
MSEPSDAPLSGDEADDSAGAITRRLRRGTALVFAGSVLGYGINYLLTPLLGRLVTPETFGTFAAILATATMFIGASTLRLEIFAASARSAAHRINAQLLALLFAAAASIAISAVITAIILVTGASPLWLLAGPMVFMGSLQLVASVLYSHERRYATLGLSNAIQGGGTGLFQVVLALVSPTAFALVGGFLLARAQWVLPLLSLRPGRMPLRSTWRRARGFASTAGASALVNSAGSQVPILLTTSMFGTVGAGIFAMAVRMLLGPIQIMAQAIGTTSVGEIGRLAARHDPKLLPTVNGLVRQLAVLMGVVALGAALLGPYLANALLGNAWEDVGTTLRVLSVGAFAQGVGSPLAQILNLTKRPGILMAWDATRVVLFTAIFIGIPLAGGGMIAAATAYSGAMVILYAALYLLVRRACRQNTLARTSN